MLSLFKFVGKLSMPCQLNPKATKMDAFQQKRCRNAGCEGRACADAASSLRLTAAFLCNPSSYDSKGY